MGKYLVENEVHILGLQRTGQHGIISWLMGHFDKVVFKNGMTPLQDKQKRGVEPPFRYFDLTKEVRLNKWEESDSKKIRPNQEAFFLGTEYLWPKIDLNPSLESDKKTLCEINGAEEFSEKQHYFIVLRSPYNHLASLIKWKGQWGMSKRFAKCWVAFAKECVGETDIIPHPKTVILYDKWFTDEEYRRQIVEKAGIGPLNDRTLGQVMRIGAGRRWGSSFDSMEYKHDAQKMDVLNRWKAYEDNEFFIKIMGNKALRNLSEQLFGEFPI